MVVDQGSKALAWRGSATAQVNPGSTFVAPWLDVRGIRGRVFLDVGGAWFDQLDQDFDFWNSDENRLEDGLSSYGWGLTVRLIGLELNWDFAQVWDFEHRDPDGFSTSFWIGTRF